MIGMHVVVSVSGTAETAMICGILRGREGITVASVEGPKEAVRAIRSERVDALVFSADNENGAELASEKVPYRVMIVRNHARGSIRDAEALGVFDVLVRPLDPERLAWCVDEMMRRRSEIEALSSPISQASVDRAFGRHVVRADGESAAAGNVAMLDAVISALDPSENGMSASQVGDALKISRITARRYCEALVNIGALRVENLYQIKGRPIKLYVRNR